MEAEITFEDFLDRASYFEYLQDIIKMFNHHVDSYLIESWRPKIERKHSRSIKGNLGHLYRIITTKNFDWNFPLGFATNPAARIENNKIRMIVRMGSTLFERTYLIETHLESFDDKIIKPRLFVPSRHPGESVEDPRISQVDNSCNFVSVLFINGLPVYPAVVTWYKRRNLVAPIMYKDVVLSDNRDTFQVTEKVIAIRPTSKYLKKAMIFLGYNDDNVIDEVFTYDFLYPTRKELKTGGGAAVKLENDLYLMIFHGIYRGEIIEAGTYVNYGILLNREGELQGVIDVPLHPLNYPYSGRRPNTVFVSGALYIKNNIEKYLPRIGDYLRDYKGVLVLLAGIDDEAIGIFVEDVEKIMEVVKWVE